jgi:hypothetical protein
MKKLTLLLLITVCLASWAHAQTDKKAPEMSKEDEAAMKAWMAYGTPGDMHTMLAKSNGVWNADLTMWSKPGAAPTKSTSTCTNTMILGNRYQQSTHTGTFEGMPFEGIGTTGYDNSKKKFVSTWIDNMGTGMMLMEGPYDAATKTIRLKGTQMDPVSGKEMGVREEFTMVDDNTQVLKMYMIPAGGKEYQSMEIKFTRAK